MAGEIVGRSVATRRRGGDASGSQGSVPGESVGGSVPCEADGSRSLDVEEGAPSSSSAAAAATVTARTVSGVDEGDSATEMLPLRERSHSPVQAVSGSVRRVKLRGIDTSSDEEGDASNVGDCATAVPLPHEPVASVGRRTKLRGIDSSSEDGQECVASRSVRQVKLRGIDTSSDEQGDASPRRLRKGVKLRGLDTSSDEER